MNSFEIRKMVEFVSALDIGTNPEPAAIFDPLIQGFNVWAIPSDHPGGDWERIVDTFDSGAYTKRSEYVGCVFYYNDDNGGYLSVSSDAYALSDHLPREYKTATMPSFIKTALKPIHNRPEDIKWVTEKAKWVFEQIGIPIPPIKIGDD